MAKTNKTNKPVNPWDLPKEDIKKQAKQIKKTTDAKEKSPLADAQEKTVIVRVGVSFKNKAKAKASSMGMTMQNYLENLIDQDTK